MIDVSWPSIDGNGNGVGSIRVSRGDVADQDLVVVGLSFRGLQVLREVSNLRSLERVELAFVHIVASDAISSEPSITNTEEGPIGIVARGLVVTVVRTMNALIDIFTLNTISRVRSIASTGE